MYQCIYVVRKSGETTDLISLSLHIVVTSKYLVDVVSVSERGVSGILYVYASGEVVLSYRYREIFLTGVE